MFTSSASPRGRFEASLGYTTTGFEKQNGDNKQTVLWPALSSLHTREESWGDGLSPKAGGQPG